MVQNQDPSDALVIQHLSDVKQLSQAVQDQLFDIPVPASWPLVQDLKFYTPKFTPESSHPLAIFADAGAIHIVYGDEVFPFSKRVDEAYRAARLKEFGRVADIESVRIFPDRRLAFFPWTSSLPNPIYEMGIHGLDIQPWTGKLYRNTWNGLLSTFPSWYILLRGGYLEQKVPLQVGNRDMAEEFAKR